MGGSPAAGISTATVRPARRVHITHPAVRFSRDGFPIGCHAAVPTCLRAVGSSHISYLREVRTVVHILRRLTTVLALVAALGFATTAFAADAKGKVKTVTADKNEFVIADADGKNWTIMTGKECKIQMNDKDAKLADLQADDEVTVTYEKDGEKLVATSIKATRK